MRPSSAGAPARGRAGTPRDRRLCRGSTGSRLNELHRFADTTGRRSDSRRRIRPTGGASKRRLVLLRIGSAAGARPSLRAVALRAWPLTTTTGIAVAQTTLSVTGTMPRVARLYGQTWCRGGAIADLRGRQGPQGHGPLTGRSPTPDRSRFAGRGTWLSCRGLQRREPSNLHPPQLM